MMELFRTKEVIMKTYGPNLIGLPVVAIILELLPYGAVLNFAPSPTETVRQTYPYFSMLPFGYANFGPLLTAVLSCLILATAVIAVLKRSRSWGKVLSILSATAFITSLMPLLFGLDYFSLIGGGISVILAVEFWLSARFSTQI